MIRNTVINTVNYFYPLGNTPAVSLTQDLPFEKDADILLLGCGDVRNILFTCFADPGRSLDITCCDIEPAIIARNILLYTLLIDDTHFAKVNQIWNIYYHWKLDDESFDLLESHIEKLLSLSKTASKWRASAYGMVIRFCDERTLTEIRKFWNRCSSRGFTGAESSQRNSILQHKIEKARKTRQEMLGEGTTLAGIRSAAPTGILAVGDFSTVAKTWWREGTTNTGEWPNLKSNKLNPALLSPTNQSLTLHYGTDPLLGFPLATAYVPLLHSSRLYVKKEGLSCAEHLAACARQHFREWADAFRTTVSGGMILRFCAADALAFSLTLQNATSQKDGRLTANFFCDNWVFEPLVFDENEYATQTQAAPRRFDIVDTSNLTDHLGPLNLMPACAALLKNETSSTAYTESLVQQYSNEKERVAGFLGGELRTVALLLGLSPCEIWTNATNSPEDESILKVLNSRTSVYKPGHYSQVRSRLRWKRTHPPDKDGSAPTVLVEAFQAAQLLVKLYDHMFQHEDMQSLFTNFNMNAFSKRSNPCYNRAGFILLLKSLQKTMATDWTECLGQMISQIFSGFSQSPIGANFAQELLLYMHMLEIDTTQLPVVSLDANKNAKMAPFFEAWPDIPAHVCVTIRVPRRMLQTFTSRAASTVGTPTLRCDIAGGGAKSRPWSNIFASVQVGFGDAQLSQHCGVPSLQIIQDDLSWWGQSDMFASTFVPTWMILQPDKTTPVVKCGLLSTAQSSRAFVKELGLTLDIFGATITSENVIVSKYMPAMSSIPKFTSEELHPRLELPHTTIAAFSSEGTTITTLTQRVSYTSEAERSKLEDRSTPVQVHFQGVLRASIKIGNEFDSLVEFPVPIDQVRHKVRIARKSCYVEIEAPLWNPLTEASSSLLFPIVPPTKSLGKPFTPVPWTATRTNLDILPVVDIEDKKKLEWLITHVSMMFSTKERQIRDADMAGRVPPGTKPNNRVEVKDSLFSIFMAYTGLQGQHAEMFGLSKEVGGIHVLFLPSCFRLDLINRTIVLDVAAVPLTNMMSADMKVRSFYEDLTSQDIMQIRVSDDELRCWKSVLPALAERCRLWRHTPNCEYARKGEVPITKGLEDGHSPLCSCGIGKFPVAYLEDMKLKNVKYVLKLYATRVTISPIFAVPYVEDCFLAGPSFPKFQKPTSAAERGCARLSVAETSVSAAPLATAPASGLIADALKLIEQKTGLGPEELSDELSSEGLEVT